MWGGGEKERERLFYCLLMNFYKLENIHLNLNLWDAVEFLNLTQNIILVGLLI